MSFILLLLLVFGVAGFAWPLCRALGASLAFVRDPSHRVLPGDPWDMFLAQMRRRLRRWVWIWVGVAVGLSALWYVMEPEIDGDDRFELVVQTLNLNALMRF